MASASNVKAGEAFIEISLDDTQLIKGLRRAQSALKTFADSVTGIGATLSALGAGLSMPMVFSTKTFMRFDDQMLQVRAYSEATEEELSKLADTAKRLGRETSFTAAQVAGAMSELAKSGFSANEISDSIQAMITLSRATGADLSQATTIAASSMRMFRMETTKAADVADLLVTTANRSAIDLEDIAESVKMAGPAAASVGEDFRDVIAAIGVLGNMGLRGTMAGTGLRSAYLRLADPKIRSELKALGVDAVDSSGNMRKLADTMTDLAEVMNRMPSADRLALAKKIFEVEGTPTGLNFTSNIEAVQQFRTALDQSAGAAQKAADTMDSGIGGSLRILLSALEGVNLELGDAIGRTIQPYVNGLSKICNTIEQWIKGNHEVIAQAVKITAAMLAAGAVFAGIGLGIKVVSGAIGALIVSMNVLCTAVMLPVQALNLFVYAVNLIPVALGLLVSAATAAAGAVWAFGNAGVFARAVVVSFHAVQAAGIAVQTAWNGLLALGHGIVLTLITAYQAIRAAVLGFSAAQLASSAIQSAWNGIAAAGQAIVTGFASALLFLKTVFLALRTASLASWAAVLAPMLAFAALGGGLVVIAMQLSKGYRSFTATLSGAGAMFGSSMKTIASVAKETFFVIKDALMLGDLAGSARVGLAALKVAWLAGLLPLKQAWLQFKNFLQDAWTLFSFSILKAGNDLWYGLLIGLKAVGVSIANAWDSIWNGIIGAFEITVAKLKKEWIRLKGIFSDRQEKDAAIAAVDRELLAKQQKRQGEQEKNRARRSGEIAALEQEKKVSGDAIEIAMNQELMQNQDAYKTTMADAARGLSVAKNEWRSAMDELKAKVASGEIKTPAQTKKEVTEKIHVKGVDLTPELPAASGAGKAVGAWSLEQLEASLGGGSAADRTASAAEKSVHLAQLSLEQQKKQTQSLDSMKKRMTTSQLVYD